jgi:ABC-type transporter MlaC component
MTKQYYIVSEGELFDLVEYTKVYKEYITLRYSDYIIKLSERELDIAKAACRARPINSSDEYYIVSKKLLQRLESLAFDYGYLSGSDGQYHKKLDAKYEVDQTLKDCFGISYCFEEG